jgi:hypothetical protein
MRPALFHPKARAVLKSFPEDVRREIGRAIFDMQKGAEAFDALIQADAFGGPGG